MYKLSLGIEHLFTGIQLTEQNPHRPPNSPYHTSAIYTFQQESPTIVRVLCDEPFQAYWPCKQSFLSSVECTPEEEQEYTGPKHQVVNLPYVVLKALRRKYGKYADEVATTLRWDSLNKCWFYTRNGIFFGVEEDGYIHT